MDSPSGREDIADHLDAAHTRELRLACDGPVTGAGGSHVNVDFLAHPAVRAVAVRTDILIGSNPSALVAGATIGTPAPDGNEYVTTGFERCRDIAEIMKNPSTTGVGPKSYSRPIEDVLHCDRYPCCVETPGDWGYTVGFQDVRTRPLALATSYDFPPDGLQPQH